MVMALVNRRLGASGTCTDAVMPSKLKLWPTLPGANVTLVESTPEFPPTTSTALPSAGHQLTRPDEAGTQLVGGNEGLHLPAEPALYMAAISPPDRARPYTAGSSILPAMQ